jgi:hypothetical protein
MLLQELISTAQECKKTAFLNERLLVVLPFTSVNH